MLLFFFFFFFFSTASSQSQENFTFAGFHGANVSLDGLAVITADGLLRLTNATDQHIGRAFYNTPLRFKDASNGKVFSFSTAFVFGIVPEDPPNLGGHGIAFVVSPSKEFPGAVPSQYLGLFNATSNGNSSNHVLAIELDTIRSIEFGDINANHVGIDVNSLISIQSAPASYFSNGANTGITLISGKPMQVWVDYDGGGDQLNVTIAPINTQKPKLPLLSAVINLSSVTKDEMYVGFSSSTGTLLTYHYILGWSFNMNGDALLDLSRLPSLPNKKNRKQNSKAMVLAILLPLIGTAFVLTAILGIIYVMRRIKFAEILEDWELEYGPHPFSYKDLYMATKGFSDKELLGAGGFGRVYHGVLRSKIQVAVKKISHGSRQGMREFVAEIASIGRIRHRNLVRLLGYCRRKGELLLVYDFMPNGSLDKLLFDQTKAPLSWGQRFHIVKGVATGLLYLHEEWVQVVLHRDIKASNVLLDHEMNGALGDFGLARLYDHGSDPQTTHMVGTFGYIAPELTRTGKATTGTDVFAFGVFLLEVACGRRPLSRSRSAEEGEEDLILVDYVVGCWKRGEILEAADTNLKGECVEEELEMVLKLALLCSHPLVVCRPSMRQVVQFLDGSASFPNLSVDGFGGGHLNLGQDEGFDDFPMTFPSTVADSFFSGGR
ncbi:hypothetical protein AAC387_Pa09g1594 [Persea americana]